MLDERIVAKSVSVAQKIKNHFKKQLVIIMPIILITGANGHGKGQFAIKKILELQQENDKRQKEGKPRRQIYANIHGINEEGAKPLTDVLPIPSDKIFFGKQDNPNDPPPDDYFIPPIGSIFFYDEAQKEDWVKQKAGALSNDPRVRSLEEHRHAGLDIYFITQSPNYIHSHIFDLVSPHYYVERPLGLKTTNVFMYNKAQKTPQSKTIKATADDQFMISLGEKYGQYYKSSSEHNMKSTVPLKIKIAIGFFLFIMALLLYKGLQANKYYDERNSEEVVSSEMPQTTSNAIQKNAINSTVQDEAQSRLDKLKIELETLKIEREINEQKRLIELTDNNLPDDYMLYKQNEQLQVRGVIKRGNTCHAYNTTGDLMTLSFKECNYYLEDYGRVHKPQGNVTNSNLKETL